MEYEVGNLTRGASYLHRVVEAMRVATEPGLMRVGALAIALVGAVAGISEHLDLAEEVLKQYPLGPSDPGYGFDHWRASALIAVRRGDQLEAQKLYTAGESTGWQIRFGYGWSTDHTMALLAKTMGNLDQATGHFEEGLAFCRKAGYRPELARICCDYADVLLQRDGPGEKEKAVSLLDEGLAITRDLGMRPLMERILSRREILKA